MTAGGGKCFHNTTPVVIVTKGGSVQNPCKKSGLSDGTIGTPWTGGPSGGGRAREQWTAARPLRAEGTLAPSICTRDHHGGREGGWAGLARRLPARRTPGSPEGSSSDVGREIGAYQGTLAPSICTQDSWWRSCGYCGFPVVKQLGHITDGKQKEIISGNPISRAIIHEMWQKMNDCVSNLQKKRNRDGRVMIENETKDQEWLHRPRMTILCFTCLYFPCRW